ncbi:MAG: hypothetical protein JKY88_18195 [Pseudomonadales bacterium]|nr:hypothetical protein [Pseudomonadales bacterium]
MSGFEVVLKRQTILSASTRDFRFVRRDGKNVSFQAGQFFRFTFTDNQGSFERSYSLCNFENKVIKGSATKPDDMLISSNLDLVISTVEGGRASELLFQGLSEVGATVKGPYGRLLLPKVFPKRLFLVATSVGVAPYITMLEPLSTALKKHELEVHFLFGVRDPSEFIYGELLEEFEQKHENFHLSVCYSRETVDKPNAYKGYVQARIHDLLPQPDSDHFLLCGHPGMIDEVYAELKTLGFGVKQVVREKYVFSKETKTKTSIDLSGSDKDLLAEKMKKYLC